MCFNNYIKDDIVIVPSIKKGYSFKIKHSIFSSTLIK